MGARPSDPRGFIIFAIIINIYIHWILHVEVEIIDTVSWAPTKPAPETKSSYEEGIHILHETKPLTDFNDVNPQVI